MTTLASDTHADDGMRRAQRLRESREFLNLSQQFVSDQTGIPRSAISDIERGQRGVDSLELKRLAALYRMPIDYYLSDRAAEGVAAEADDPTIRALARAASQMTAAEKEEVLRFALFLKNFERPQERKDADLG